MPSKHLVFSGALPASKHLVFGDPTHPPALLSAAPSIQASLAACVTAERRLSAAPSAQASLTGAFGTPVPLSAAASAQASLAGALAVEHRLSASPLALATLAAGITAEHRLAASPLALATLAATLHIPGDIELAAAPSVQASLAACVTAERRLSAPLGAQAALAGFLEPGCAATFIAAQAGLAACVTVGRRLSAPLGAQAALAANVTVEHRLAAAPAAQASAACALVQARRLRCALQAASGLSSSLAVERRLSAALSARASLAASPVSAKPLAAAAQARADAYAVLHTGATVQPGYPGGRWVTPPLRIGGIPVEFPASLGLTEAWEDEGGEINLRAASGALLPQAYWTRRKAVFSGDGPAPAGLDGLDWAEPHWVDCGQPLSVYASGLTVRLPAARRADVALKGLALVGGGSQETPVELDGDYASLTAVAGAYGYQVQFTPRFRAYLNRTGSLDRPAGSHAWAITAEEV